MFSSKYSESTVPLLKLLTNGVHWEWTEQHSIVFKNVKQLFLKAVMLHHPIADKRFYLQTDASNIAVGSQLYQLGENNEKFVIGFAGRTLKGAELTYFTTEKELLAIVHSLEAMC